MQQRGERAPNLRFQGRSLSARDSREDTYHTLDHGGLLATPYGLKTTGSMSLPVESHLKPCPHRILPATPKDKEPEQTIRSPANMSAGREQAVESDSSPQRLSRSSSSTRRLPAMPSTEAHLMPSEGDLRDVLNNKRRFFSHKLNGQWYFMGQNDSQMNSNANSSQQESRATNPHTASVSFDFSSTEPTSGSQGNGGLRPSGNKSPSPRREMSPRLGGKSVKARTSVTIRTDSTTSESGTLATSNHLSVADELKVHESLSLNNLTKDGLPTASSSSTTAVKLPRRGQNSRKSAEEPKKWSPASNSSRSNSGWNLASSTNKSSRDSPSLKSTSSPKRLPGISSASQQIIGYCMDNAKGDIAGRVVARMAHKRNDFAGFCTNLSPENWLAFLNQFREYLMEVVKNLQRVDKIKEVSMKFGCDQVPRRVLGFKADFFSIMADALITECVFLDGAAHQPTEAIEAWSELVSGHMFSNIRDGYYQQIRYLRRNTQCFSSMFNHSSDQSTEGGDMPPAASANCSTANGDSTSYISVPTNK